MSKHTPGPWLIATCDTGKPSPEYAIVDAEGYTVAPPIHRLGDARLMAAAPELLRSLRDMVRAYEERLRDPENDLGPSASEHVIIDIAKAAIAAAEGSSE